MLYVCLRNIYRLLHNVASWHTLLLLLSQACLILVKGKLSRLNAHLTLFCVTDSITSDFSLSFSICSFHLVANTAAFTIEYQFTLDIGSEHITSNKIL